MEFIGMDFGGLLSGALGVVFLALIAATPIVFVFLFKDKMAMFPRKEKYKAWIYHLRNGVNVTADFKPKVSDFEFSEEVLIWEVVKNKVPIAMLQTNWLVGAIEVDAAIFASVEQIGKYRVIRLWEQVEGLKKAGNYLPLNLPSEVSYEKWRGYLTGRGKTMINDIKQEWSRPKDTSLITNVVLPIVSLLVCLVMVIVVMDNLGKNMDRATGLYTSTVADSTQQIVSACGGSYVNPNAQVANTTKPNANVIPFFG